jgi:hypothetical protein
MNDAAPKARFAVDGDHAIMDTTMIGVSAKLIARQAPWK